ncbi:hypothetical protein pah_c197o106 [Parachlamydia acanthamoebae str. Hall's coccus]|nr:hypothetical protein pah_c197o106 [Parachlamydia acanthamoebae str. Hall's coccus]
MVATDGSITTQTLSAGNTITLSLSGSFPAGSAEIIATPINASTGFAELTYNVSMNGPVYTFASISAVAGESAITRFNVPYHF